MLLSLLLLIPLLGALLITLIPGDRTSCFFRSFTAVVLIAQCVASAAY